MVGARISLVVAGLPEARRDLGALAAAARDLTPAMRDIGEYLLRSTRDRFVEEQAPDGAPWAPLSEATRRRKRRNRDKILTQDGLLSGTLNYRASPTELLFGSPRVYAGTHQFGAEKGAFGQTSRGSSIPWGDIPARPFLGLSDGDEDEIGELVRDYLLEALPRGR